MAATLFCSFLPVLCVLYHTKKRGVLNTHETLSFLLGESVNIDALIKMHPRSGGLSAAHTLSTYLLRLY